MSSRRKIWIMATLLILLAGTGAYELWQKTALRYPPWQLESYVDVLAAECRTGPGAYVFAEELHALTVQVNEAKLCLVNAHQAWAVGRDYTPCTESLLRASLTALRIRISQAVRIHETRIRLDRYLRELEFNLSNGKLAPGTGARLEIRNDSQSRARMLMAQAYNLAERGQTDSALAAVLSAQAAWEQNKDFQAAELARFYDPALMARWEKEAQDLLQWTKRTGNSAILVDKLEHRCLLLTAGRVEKSYVANLGRNWHRIKVQEHDASTPEGEYTVRRKFRSGSYGWALLLSYPNDADRKRFNSLKNAGEIATPARIGGSIEIHGGGRLNSDWTDGCISLENRDMADLYKRAYAGMPVTIVGTCLLGNSGRD